MACPNNAIVSEDGCVKVLQERCIGCKSCVVACPYGAMAVVLKEVPPTADSLFKRPQTKAQALKCDLCRHREAGPACVEVCPTQALRLVTQVVQPLRRPGHRGTGTGRNQGEGQQDKDQQPEEGTGLHSRIVFAAGIRSPGWRRSFRPRSRR